MSCRVSFTRISDGSSINMPCDEAWVDVTLYVLKQEEASWMRNGRLLSSVSNGVKEVARENIPYAKDVILEKKLDDSSRIVVRHNQLSRKSLISLIQNLRQCTSIDELRRRMTSSAHRVQDNPLTHSQEYHE